MKIRKTQKMGFLGVVAVIAFILVAASQLGLLDRFKTGTTDQVVGTTTTGTQACQDSSVTMTVGPATKWRVPGTTVTNEYHRVYVDGIDQGLQLDGSTISVRVNGVTGNTNRIKVYYAENSTDYYSAESEFNVPCGAFDSASLSNGKHQIANHTTDITFNTFNQDDGDLNSATNNQTITTNEEVSFKLDWKGDSDESVSPYGKAIVVVGFNNTEFDSAKIKLGSYPRTAVPSIHTTPHIDFKQVAFEVPGGPDPSTTTGGGKWTLGGDLTVKAKSVNPGTSSQYMYLNVTVYNQDWAQDPEQPIEVFGVEDSQGTRIGFRPISTVITYT